MEQDEPRFEFYDIEVDADKWLWAARFFKTRALARAAVENGKVYYNGERSKPSREIEIEAILQIRHGRYEKTVIVKGLSTRRRSTEEALQLFEETEESRIARENMAEYHATPMGQPMPYGVYNNNHTPRFQEQQSYSAFAPSTDQAPKRRAVRFLRRSFVRAGEGLPTDTVPNPNQSYGQGTPTAPMFNQQGHFNPNGHAPHVPQPIRQENYPVNTQYGHPEQRHHYNSPGNHAGYDNRRSDNYRHDNYGHSHSHHSGHTHNPYRQADRQPAYNSVQPQNVNQHPYPQAQNHGYPGHHPRHQNNNNQNYNYYGPQSYKEANGNIGHLPLKEKETEIEESSD
jgi:ribosomal 50S subunit-recycling heat shock protein